MLSIGCALMSLPKLLILDEPSLGLAPKLIQELTEGISKISSAGVTMLLIDQNLELLLECCKILLPFEQGLISSETMNRNEIDGLKLLDYYFGKEM